MTILYSLRHIFLIYCQHAALDLYLARLCVLPLEKVHSFSSKRANVETMQADFLPKSIHDENEFHVFFDFYITTENE